MFTIVVAGGSSERFGSNKLNQIIDEETVLERTVRIALESSDGVIVVTDPKTYINPQVFAVVNGGATRSDSVRNGLGKVPLDVAIIAIQDGARPMSSVELYKNGRELIENGALGAIPVISVTDTIKKVDKSVVKETLDREELRAVQTPQIFDAHTLRTVYSSDIVATDDASLFEKSGIEVSTFKGNVQNIKITTKTDIDFIRSLSSQNKSVPRIGTGYDIHPFSNDPNKKLILGGISIDHIGLDGHSDSDCVAHSLTDALLSAIGEKDLGTLFPASHSENKNQDSFVFLEKAVQFVEKAGFSLGNVSIIINAQEPKLAKHIEPMKEKLSIALKSISQSFTQITITPKHGEGIGEIGRSEAIAVYCTLLLAK